MPTRRFFIVLGLLNFVLGCGGGDEDTFEESYARAVCERDFSCYPAVAKNHQDEVSSCISSRLVDLRQRRAASAEACVDATLDLWACQSQLECYAEYDITGCAVPKMTVQQSCPHLSMP